MKKLSRIAALVLASLLLFACGTPKDNSGPATENHKLILATTTSTQDTGLLDELVPMFEEETDYEVDVIAVGTGAALQMGKDGNADVLLTHAPASEQELVDDEIVTNYQLVMHNDFIIIGPKDDPAKIADAKTAAEAMKFISESESTFVSRGDDSGTHKKELSIWKKAEIEPEGEWYVESGSGMATTLNIANDKLGYTLTDRGTYLAHKKNLDLVPLVEGDEALLNIYHVMQVNPAKYDKVNADGAKAFVEFMVRKDVQEFIKDFGVDKYGEPLFFPDALDK